MSNVEAPPTHVALAAGGLAGLSVDVALYPLDTIKTRMQAPEGFFKAGGFRGIYRGLSAAAAGSVPGAALFFGTYETAKQALKPYMGESPLAYCTASAFGEMGACLVRVPTEVVKQRMQAGIYSGLLEGVQSVLKNEGVMGFYQGYFTTVMREIPFAFVQFPVYESLKKQVALLQGKEVPDAIPAAACGSVAGGFAAAVTTPLDVAKTRLMLGADAEGVAYKGTLDTLSRVYAEGGMRGLFAGVTPRVTWISIGGFVFFGSYEAAKRVLLNYLP